MDGIFGNNLLLYCLHEQLQLAAFHLLVAYCAACPGQIVLTKAATDAVKYSDIGFYLTLWDKEDNNLQDHTLDGEDGLLTTDNTLQEDHKAVAFSTSQGFCCPAKYCLYCEVKFRNLKRRRTNPA